MRFFVVFILFVPVVLFIFPFRASAGLLTVNSRGEVVVNVLSSEDSIALIPQKQGEIEVSQVAGGDRGDNSIYLEKNDDKIVLNVGEGKSLDVTGWEDNLIEIEERGDVKKIKISIKDGKFEIAQGNVHAQTIYPINIKPKENELSVVTSTGSSYLAILPQEAVETVLRTRVITKATPDTLEINEHDTGVLTYNVAGVKELNILNILDYSVPVVAFVSTTTGEVIRIDQPKWLSVVGFLFS